MANTGTSTSLSMSSTNCGNSTVFCTVSTIRHLSLHNDGHEPCPRKRPESSRFSALSEPSGTCHCNNDGQEPCPRTHAESSRFSALSGQPPVLHHNGQQPCPRTHAETSRFSALSGPSPAPVNAQQWARKQLLHSLHCAYTPLKHNWKLEQSVEERKLRHLHVLVRMQELELHNYRGRP